MKHSFKIDYDIPLPRSKYGFIFEMEKGGSYLFECSKEERLIKMNTIKTTAHYHGIIVSCRSEERGVRIWRVK